MLDKQPSLLNEQYIETEYKGENVLHIAIVKKRADLVKELVELEKKSVQLKPKLMEARATGNFFTVSSSSFYRGMHYFLIISFSVRCSLFVV